MSLQRFKTRVFSETGLSRSNKWFLRIYPPRGISSIGNQLSNLLNDTPGVEGTDVDLPIFDFLDTATENLSDVNLDIGAGVQLGRNQNQAPLGFLTGRTKDIIEHINLFAASCQIPTRDIAGTVGQQYGQEQTIGYNHTHADFTTEFYCAEDLRERKFFEQWQDIIFNPRTGNVGYYKDYVSRVEVYKLNYNNRTKETAYRMFECYPTNIQALELSQEEGSLLKLNITWKYRYYKRIDVDND